MNQYVSPSNLISISIFEDDHPCENQIYHFVVLHKSRGDTILDKKDIKGDIYKLQFHSIDKGWEELSEEVCKAMDREGFSQMRYLVGTTNYSDGDGQAYAMLSWNKTHEDALQDTTRGGCSCSIF